jgi:hypothetical protein
MNFIPVTFAEMRLFSFLMAFLVLALSCLPCADAAPVGKANNAKTEISKTNGQQENDHTDDCSPFCTCNCCAVSSYVTVPFQLEHFRSASAGIPAVHLPSNTASVSLPVWQPPQLI